MGGILWSLLVAISRPKTYTSTFSFLPQTGQEQVPAGLASLVGQLGIAIPARGGLSQSPELYADILTTREVLAPIAADSFPVSEDAGLPMPLSRFLRVRGENTGEVLENTVRALRTNVVATRVATGTTGMVTVTVRTKSPHVSHAIAGRLLEGLNHFNLVTRQSQARQERLFAEGRLKEAQAALRSVEDSLLRFLETNREFNTPTPAFDHDRLQRSVQFQQQIVTSLAQEYELNRLREARDTPVITVIEQPTVPLFPDPRLRLLILFLGTAGGLAVGSLVVVAWDAWVRERSNGDNPDLVLLAAEWQRIRGRLRWPGRSGSASA